MVFLGVRGGELGVGWYVYAGYARVRVMVSIRRSGRRLGGRYRQISSANISVRWAGNARPLALPLGELARLKAVTERVPGRNHDTNAQTCNCLRPLSLASLDSSPIGRAKGGCAAGFALCYPLRWAGSARPLAPPMGELARRKP